MTALGFALAGATSGNPVEADANGNLQVNLPVAASQAGFARLTSSDDGTQFNAADITEDGNVSVAQNYPLWSAVFNGWASTATHKVMAALTTMTRGISSGFLTLNAGSITTTATGISVISSRNINIDEAGQLRVRVYAKTANATATNKQMDLGLGYYAFNTGQAAAMNEFVGFRWTTTGGLLGVLETSQGGAPTSQTININGNVPFSDAVVREYELRITEKRVTFYVDGTAYGSITRPTGSWGIFKGVSLPWIARVFNSGTASAAAQLAIGLVDIQRYQSDIPPASYIQALQGKASTHAPNDLGQTAVTHVAPASGTAPTANVGSNTASAFNATTALGGWYRNTLTGVTSTTHTNVLVSAFTNPAVPTAAGVANNSRNFVVTGISISPMVVTTALTGGGFTANWFVAIGATAVSLATTDTDGTTTPPVKSPKFIPLNLMSTLAAAAAAGVVSTDVGDHNFLFPTPLVVHPGETIAVGFRTIIATAITIGAADGSIYVNGYWE